MCYSPRRALEWLPEIFTVIEFQELGPNAVQITISMVGYRAGAGNDVIYRHFEGGNDWSLRQLYKRFAEGPIDWKKGLGGEPAQRYAAA